MSSSESAGRKGLAGPSEAAKKTKKERVVGLSIIGVAFLLALALSNYSANVTEAGKKKSAVEASR